jgi:hypothetical protein
MPFMHCMVTVPEGKRSRIWKSGFERMDQELERFAARTVFTIRRFAVLPPSYTQTEPCAIYDDR